MLSYFQAVVLGLVEGITEFLPISSTGHLILTANLMKIGESEFIKSFEIIIQLGAILAVVALYFKSLIFNREILKRVILGFIPTGVVGLIFYRLVKGWLGNPQIVLWSLLLGGLVLVFFEKYFKTNEGEGSVENLTYRHSLLIGLFQALAIVPGVSRSAATIIGGLILRYPRKVIVEYSFLLAIPTMLASTGLELFKSASNFDFNQASFLVVGFMVSFVTALGAVKWLLNFIKNHTFSIFGVYRIIVGLLGFLII